MNKVKLGQISHVVTKGTTPTTLGMKLNQGKINFVKVECLTDDGRVLFEKMQKIDGETHEKLKRSQLQVGDILYSIAGSIGRVAVVTEEFLPANTNQAIAIIRPKVELVDVSYLSYFLKDAKSQRNAQTRIVQSVQNNLSLGELSDLEVTLPSREHQNVIASIMRALDEKIDTNQRLSHTLEQIAQTIFKSWFVDYDPVKAKMAGEKPLGMDDATAALFPDSFEESELGQIPSGWSVEKLGSICNLSWGDTKTTKSSYVSDGYIAFSAKGPDGFLSKFDYEQSGIVLSAIGAGCGTTWYTSGKWSCIKNTIRIIETTKFLESIPYIYLATHGKEFWPKRGSAQPFISQEDARNIELVVPSSSVLSHFGLLAERLLDGAQIYRKTNELLVDLRDEILPRLISGELPIPAEMLVL
jgi:type I restriction enzyme S subunit